MLKVLSATLMAGVAAVALLAGYLAYPGNPSRSKYMKFEGFIELPREGMLTVLDYLTLSHQTLFVASESSGTVFKIDLDPNSYASSPITIQRGSGSAHGIVLAPDTNAGFVTRSEANVVDVFDPKTLAPLGSIPVADDPDGIQYIPSTRLLYVANGDPKMATLIDPVQRATVGTISLPGKPEFAAVDPASGWLYQNLTGTNTVAAIDIAKRAVTAQWPLAPCRRPTGMAIDAKLRRLFSVCADSANLVVFDLDAHRVVTSMKIGGGADSVAFDPALRRIYSAGRSGELTVIQQDGADSYRILDRIHTHYGAHTLAVDPVSHKVFVAYAVLLAAPRIAVFAPAP
ncbi:MAG: hypothetical protein HIU93_15235 [Acidobacteria bacterium]|nr:hypothetical protein [Acidobacteriota bacterium]MBW4044324.1 hypothetical protein [Acidobacteriota bacterium]